MCFHFCNSFLPSFLHVFGPCLSMKNKHMFCGKERKELSTRKSLYKSRLTLILREKQIKVDISHWRLMIDLWGQF